MSKVDTVRGPVEVSELGRTLAHEHPISISSEFSKFYPEFAWGPGGRDAVLKHVVGRLQAARAGGITTIIDATANMHDRDLDFVRDVNELVDLNIVVSTGIYTYDYLPPHISYRPPRSVGDDILFRMFIRDITVGVADSGVKAMSIKIAVDKPGFTPNIERIFKAAGKASAETGATITVHHAPQLRQAARALELLTGEGADVSTIVMGHSGDTKDIDYLREIVDAGAVVGDDRFGLYMIPDSASEDERVDILKTLVKEGYADRIVLAHDTVNYSDWGEPREPGDVPGLETWVPTRVSDVVVPKLKAVGVTDEEIDALLVTTPASLFKNIAS